MEFKVIERFVNSLMALCHCAKNRRYSPSASMVNEVEVQLLSVPCYQVVKS